MIGVPINMLFVAHTDTHHRSTSFTHQQTDSQIDQASALASNRILMEFGWSMEDIKRMYLFTQFKGVPFFKVCFFFK